MCFNQRLGVSLCLVLGWFFGGRIWDFAEKFGILGGIWDFGEEIWDWREIWDLGGVWGGLLGNFRSDFGDFLGLLGRIWGIFGVFLVGIFRYFSVGFGEFLGRFLG